MQRRLRALPSRVGVYFLLAMCLFPEVGYLLVWQKLTASLSALPVVTPTTKALRDLRRRVGGAPMRRLFEVLSGPLAQPATPGVRFGTYRTVSFDGCSSLKAPDTVRNRAWLGSPGHGGYPLLELMTLVETGTRALIGAVFGPTGEGESGYARRLLHLLTPDMLVLWDKGFDGNAFLAQVSATGAQVLGRLRSNRRTPILATLTDGSYLSMIGSLQIRVIEARITVACADGTTFTGTYRLVTTLTDARRYPAATLVRLYHQRWEHESTYYALRHTIMQGRILRSGDPAGLEQEMWSVLTLYQLLRSVMVDAAESRPGTDPTAAASPSPCIPPATWSSARATTPAWPPAWSQPSDAVSWRRCCHHAARASAPARSNHPPPATTNGSTTAGPTAAAPSPTSTSLSCHPRPRCPPCPGTNDPCPPATAADNNRSWPSFTKTPPAPGRPGTSPATSVMSP
uniref:Transposase, IS4 n=2 Tax=Nonomuraea gerenzanensis TaxID=93944 RepID=A0A1M4ECS5_9ACTN|nr:Transposase, IS4 [Nonomuraea gerenzanensis]